MSADTVNLESEPGGTRRRAVYAPFRVIGRGIGAAAVKFARTVRRKKGRARRSRATHAAPLASLTMLVDEPRSLLIEEEQPRYELFLP